MSDVTATKEAVESGELQRVINGMDIAGIHPSLKLLCDAARSYVRLVETGEELKEATIRDKRGKYRNGDFLVVRLEDGQ